MDINLSDHFTFPKIFRFCLPPILMMLFTSLYGIVDGFFISNFAGIDEYSGVNLIFPITMLIGGLGFMFGTGGTALTSMYLGKQDKENADASFTMIFKAMTIVGIIVSIIGFVFIRPIAEAFGSLTNGTTQSMVNEAVKYGSILTLGQVFFMLQCAFQSYLIVDEKPNMGFRCTLLAGITNMVLDGLFIAVFKWGVIGAAIATILGYITGCIIPFVHFMNNKNGNIQFVKTKINLKLIGKACVNGSSEFVNNISNSIVGIVFNIQLLKYFGQDGVSAYGTLMYISFLFYAIYIGYSIGMAPVVGYNYGANNKVELKNVLSKSLILIAIISVLMFIASEILGPLFAKLYVGNSPNLLEITIQAFIINSIQFLFCGFSVYISSFFTALNNGLISAIISFIRTLVLQILFVLILPSLFGKEFIWWSIVIAEAVSGIMSISILFAMRHKYGFFDKNLVITI